jgi:hypothetical protein
MGGLLSIMLLWAQWLAIRAKLWRLQGKLNKLQTLVKTQHNVKTANLSSKDQQIAEDA